MRTVAFVPLLALVPTGCGSEDERPSPAQETEVSDARSTSGAHRLNRAQWGNSLHELLGTDPSVVSVLPVDLGTYGYDTVASGLATSPVHVELLESIVISALDDFFGRHPESTSVFSYQAEDSPALSYDGGVATEDAYVLRADEDTITATTSLQFGGEYLVSIQAMSPGTGDDTPLLSIAWNGGDLLSAQRLSDDLPPNPAPFTWTVHLEEGLNAMSVHVISDGIYDDQQAAIDWIRIEGPLDPVIGRAETYARVFTCNPDFDDPDLCAEEVLSGFAFRAWRSPVSAEDVQPYVGLYTTALDAGLAWDEAVQLGMQGILMAPDFSYRMAKGRVDSPGHMTDYEIASQLSYFLWSSPPDDSLMLAADAGELSDPALLDAHITRMLEDPKATALVDEFAAQWLGIRELTSIQPDALLYANWSEDLRGSMAAEMSALAHRFILEEKLDLREIVSYGEAWIDDRLAAHYQLPSPGPQGAWVMLDNTPRAGILGTAGWLTSQSHPEQPSAVLRGKWILDNLLCDPVEPPPPEVAAMTPPDPTEGSVREQEEALRSDPFCQQCHQLMDPLGFALNGFDVIGGIRGLDELGYPIDSTSQLVSGDELRSIVELGPMIAHDPRFTRCLVEQVYTYGLGRAPTATDAYILDGIVEEFQANGHTFDALVRAIAHSPALLERPIAVEE